ncbi:MAG: Sua5/YciO/YrdC/YwlC family protein, partial [Spirochaetaceae bacterium]|nr:Sua5/YciO/YrdC/YwlC family protein [Spirochaetaceae bacterium]
MLLKRSDKSRRILTDCLKAGEVVVMACDTIYGLVGRVPDTEHLIREIKGRGENSPFLQLISDITVLDSGNVILPQSDILNLWPGPFTFVLPLVDGGSTAFRVPEDSSLRNLIRELGFPLYSSSVNRSGNS